MKRNERREREGCLFNSPICWMVLLTGSPYLSMKSIFKPFKMASSGYQGNSVKVITAMETLSVA